MKMFYTFTVRPPNHGETSKCLFQRPNESQQSATHTTCLLPVPPPCSLALAFDPSHIPLALSHCASSSVSWQLAGRGLGRQRPELCMQASNPSVRILAAQTQADGLTCPKLLSWTLCSCATQLLHITPWFLHKQSKINGRSKSNGQRWPCGVPQDNHVKVALAAHPKLYGNDGPVFSYILEWGGAYGLRF